MLYPYNRRCTGLAEFHRLSERTSNPLHRRRFAPWKQMTVTVQSKFDVGMSHNRLNGFDIGTRSNQPTGSGVA